MNGIGEYCMTALRCESLPGRSHTPTECAKNTRTGVSLLGPLLKVMFAVSNVRYEVTSSGTKACLHVDQKQQVSKAQCS